MANHHVTSRTGGKIVAKRCIIAYVIVVSIVVIIVIIVVTGYIKWKVTRYLITELCYIQS